MNLVVIARRPETGERAAETISRLTGRHPSRTLIVLSADPDGPSWLDARIQAHCVLPRADAPETCSEPIYLTAGGETGRHLSALVAPLLIHDLPVTVWWPGEPPFGSEPADALFAMTDRLMVDGSTWSGDGLARLRAAGGAARQRRTAVDPRLRARPPVALARGDRRRSSTSRSSSPTSRTCGGWPWRTPRARRDRARPGRRTWSSRCTTSPGWRRGWACGSTRRWRRWSHVRRPAASARHAARREVAAPPGAGGATRPWLVVVRGGRRDPAADLVACRPGPRCAWSCSRSGAAPSCAPTSPPRPRTSTSASGRTGCRPWIARSRRPAARDVDLLSEAIEAGGRDPVVVGTIRMAAALVGEVRP